MLKTPQWESIISDLVAEPGVVMVIGGVDVGKTSFCLQLCNAGVEAGITTAVVDADIGQSEIGVPGTIGAAAADSQIESLSDLKAKRIYFVGATNPTGHTLECVTGTKKMVDFARNLGAKLVIVDTTGLVDGPIGRKLKTCKIDMARPKYVVGIQKHREIEHLLAPFMRVNTISIKILKSSEAARKKPPEYRAARRQVNFFKHFHDAAGHVIKLDNVSIWNTWLCSGRMMKWQYMKFIEDALNCHVLHAEIIGRGIFIITEHVCSNQGYIKLEEEFRTSNITVVSADRFQNLLVGLADENANIINIGLIQAIDFKQRFMYVISPIKTVSPVSVVQFGSIRVDKDGKEIGVIKQGEL